MKFRGLCLFLQNKFQILQNLGVATNQKVAGSNPSSRTKTKGNCESSCLLFWVPAAGGGLHPFGFQMLGGSTRKGYATSVRRQSRQRLCSEFRLHRGFAWGKTLARRKGAAGQKAGRPAPSRVFIS